MKDSEIYDKLRKAIDSEIDGWGMADRLSELEQRAKAQNMIYGIVKAGLYVLPGDYYSQLVKYVHEKGFNH